MDTLWQDLKYALRGFARQPAFTFTIIATLAIGIGANTVIFSVVNALLLNPLSLVGWKNPERIVMLWEKNASLTLFMANQMPVRPQNYRAWKEQARSFQRLAAWRDFAVTLTDRNSGGARKPEQMESGATTAELFSLIGVRPRLGRDFLPDEMLTGKNRVAILSGELYRDRFNSNPQILGSSLLLNGKPFVIIGVLPPAVAFPAIWGGMEKKNPSSGLLSTSTRKRKTTKRPASWSSVD